jgi:hypothetical protein
MELVAPMVPLPELLALVASDTLRTNFFVALLHLLHLVADDDQQQPA